MGVPGSNLVQGTDFPQLFHWNSGWRNRTLKYTFARQWPCLRNNISLFLSFSASLLLPFLLPYWQQNCVVISLLLSLKRSNLHCFLHRLPAPHSPVLDRTVWKTSCLKKSRRGLRVLNRPSVSTSESVVESVWRWVVYEATVVQCVKRVQGSLSIYEPIT